MINKIDGKVRIKRSTTIGEVPTIPVSTDHTDGTWNNTDIYVGEYFLNTQDDRIWLRTDNSLVEIHNESINVLPDTTATLDLGSSSLRYKSLYLSEVVDVSDGLYINSGTVSSSATGNINSSIVSSNNCNIEDGVVKGAIIASGGSDILETNNTTLSDSVVIIGSQASDIITTSTRNAWICGIYSSQGCSINVNSADIHKFNTIFGSSTSTITSSTAETRSCGIYSSISSSVNNSVESSVMNSVSCDIIPNSGTIVNSSTILCSSYSTIGTLGTTSTAGCLMAATLISTFSGDNSTSAIIGGYNNAIRDSNYSGIFGGAGNTISGGDKCTIIGGIGCSFASGVIGGAIVGGNALICRLDNSLYVNKLVITNFSGVPISSASTSGDTGSILWDANYLYVKTSGGIGAGGWKRTALSTF